MSNVRLLPVGSSPLEVAAAAACAELTAVPVPLRDLWNPQTCPAKFLPYLAWAFSVDRWDESWPEATKRGVIQSAYFIHTHKGTISAIRRVVEPLGYVINISEWWETNSPPGTFRLDIGVLESGITEEMYQEMERLIDGAKPCSRHLTGLSINLDVGGVSPVAVGSYSGDLLTVYPYTPESITVTGLGYSGAAIHIIDTVRVNA
jgi:phage tail P2-like protein